MVSYIWISVYSIVVLTGFLKYLITPLYRVSEVSFYTVFHRACEIVHYSVILRIPSCEHIYCFMIEVKPSQCTGSCSSVASSIVVNGVC